MLERVLAGLTRWLVRHRWMVLVGWLIPLPLLVVGYRGVNARLLSAVGSHGDAQSSVVAERLGRVFVHQSEFTTLVTFHHGRHVAEDPSFKSTVEKVSTAVRAHPCTERLTAWPDIPIRSLFVAAHEHTQLAMIELDVPRGRSDLAERCVRRLRELIGRTVPAGQGMEVLVTGVPAFNVDIAKIVRRDSLRSELSVFVISLVLLVWMFRSGPAAILPLITAALAVMSCLSVVYLVAAHVRLSVYVSTVATMSGLGLGLDYALLYVTRVKEELGRGLSTEDAIVMTSRTAGKAILGSGTLVMVGFSGLLLPKLGIARSLGLAGVLIVLCTLISTITLLPALLSCFRSGLDWPRWGWFRASHASVDRFWVRWASLVLRRPVFPLLMAALVVGAFAPHIFDLRVRSPRHEVIPRESEARRGVERVIEVVGPGHIYPVTVVAALSDGTTWDTPRRRQQLLAALRLVRSWPEVASVRGPDLLMGLSLEVFGKRLGFDFGDGFAGRFLTVDRRQVSFDVQARQITDRRLDQLVARLRAEAPAALAGGPGVSVWVGGSPATTWETKQSLIGALPTMIPAVILAAFLVMALFFRSLVVALKAVVLNVLSLATTFGLLVLVVQEGHGLWLLGLSGAPPGALSLVTPVVLFCVLFGVSMDYEVFLVSRIQETFRARGGYAAADARERERIHREAIHEGLARTGGIITNAALIMVVTFAAFVTGVLLPMKEMGFALGLAVALDATLVRMMLVPVVLRFVGCRTWWFFGWRPAAAEEATVAPSAGMATPAGPDGVRP